VHETAGSFDAGTSRDPDGSLVSYAWDFGDGASAAGATASHAYTWAGTYTVRLTITDDEGATDSVTVTDTPASGFVRLQATGLDNHKCDSTGWTFTVSNPGTAPASVAVFRADGSRERVPLTSQAIKSATYVTTGHLDQVAVKGYGDVPSSATTAKLVLARGPCH
jgi:trimeric autotransporter adhesin